MFTAHTGRRVARLAPLLALTLLVGCGRDPVFAPDPAPPGTDAWTHTEFRNNPADFQFAIASDLTGGERPGIFATAVDALNRLQPEFVITIGDLIEGYTEDPAQLHREWDAFHAQTDRLQMPFFHVAGNHDNLNTTMRAVYAERAGPAHYAFRYHNVLFLVLDTQDLNPAGFGETQLAWAQRTLQRHPDVRWTFVFMHQPLWIYEKGGFHTDFQNLPTGRPTGLPELEAALGDRPYTVFAGHFHQYVKFTRRGRAYHVLGTTGGISRLRGVSRGEIDHLMWVTMTETGPRLAPLLLDGLPPDDVHTFDHVRLRAALRLEPPEPFKPGTGGRFVLQVDNPFTETLALAFKWASAPQGGWQLDPAGIDVQLAPGDTNRLVFALRYEGAPPIPPLPACSLMARLGTNVLTTPAWILSPPPPAFAEESTHE